MSTGPRNPGAADPAASQPDPTVVRVWHRLVEALAALGTFMIGILGLIICADILARNAMGASLPLVSEMGALLVVMIVALQLAAAVRSDRLARTEVFIVPLTTRFPRIGAALALIFSLVGAWMLGLIAMNTFDILADDWTSAEFIGIVGIATLPTWPFRALILVGFAVAALEFLVRALVEARFILRGRT
ncbi:TRAP transporter small permease subunit [Palleronia abyssalis]|uniref:TRAP transporter small permease protein n=1 Tax=Palleronia abyssalis TaxID=1501240 RepID=A0A2R8BVZ9_9RHOB|nr:TRAP transporter small permease subunit [Palleronia abyssalis]SPJ24339.1 hypothetical protein PAA8504_02167 [Palleronia abyssalis]